MCAKQINKELKPGTLLRGGSYKIIDVLGIGGFGITYKAEHTGLRKILAIKEFFLSGYSMRDVDDATITLQDVESTTYDNFKIRFAEEAQTLAALEHPNIVDVIDIFEENDTTYFAMPFVAGQTLKQLVEMHEKPTEELVGYILEIGNALAYLHGEGILHRDIKPDNIIITPEGKAILIDFGSAREFIHDKTQTHTSVLTKGYAPIEQYSSSGKKGNYSDIYSLAAVLYYVLTEQKPIDATDRMVEDLEPVSALKPDVPTHISTAIDKAMAMKPADRYQTVGEFIEDLQNSLDSATKKQEVTNSLPSAIPKESIKPKKEKVKEKVDQVKTVSKVKEQEKENQNFRQKAKQSKVPPLEPASKTKKAPVRQIGIAAVILILAVIVFIVKPFGSESNQSDGKGDLSEQSEPAQGLAAVYQGVKYFSDLTDGKSKWYHAGSGDVLGADLTGINSFLEANLVDFGLDFNEDFELKYTFNGRGDFNAGLRIGGYEYQAGKINFNYSKTEKGLMIEAPLLGITKKEILSIGDDKFEIRRRNDTIQLSVNDQKLGSAVNKDQVLEGGMIAFSVKGKSVTWIQDFLLKGSLKAELDSTFSPYPLIKQEDIKKVVTQLFLANEGLRYLPDSVYSFIDLRYLYSGENQLSQLPESFGRLRNLTYLDLKVNAFKEFPRVITKLNKLRNLFLQENHINSIPKEISNLENLEMLNLSYNELGQLPETISQFEKLEYLYISNNELQVFPDSFFNLNKLIQLKAEGNSLTKIPAGIKNLSRLNTLYLDDNQIEEIPIEIFELKRLRDLDLSHNNIVSISDEIGQLVNLKRLGLAGNELESLPKSITRLTKLESLYVYDNNFSEEEKERIRNLLPNCEISF